MGAALTLRNVETRHLETSAQARPADLVSTGARDDDLAAMLAHRPLAEGDVVSPEHAIRNLLDDLLADAMDAAFDRMEAS